MQTTLNLSQGRGMPHGQNQQKHLGVSGPGVNPGIGVMGGGMNHARDDSEEASEGSDMDDFSRDMDD